MRKSLCLSVILLAGCSSPDEPQVFSTSVDVDEAEVELVLQALDQITDTEIDIGRLVVLTETTDMDAEQQERFAVTFDGNDTELLYHVWREQQDWVHLYVSSDSKDLVDAFKSAAAPFSRDDQ
jgi:hypothetical protein